MTSKQLVFNAFLKLLKPGTPRPSLDDITFGIPSAVRTATGEYNTQVEYTCTHAKVSGKGKLLYPRSNLSQFNTKFKMSIPSTAAIPVHTAELIPWINRITGAELELRDIINEPTGFTHDVKCMDGSITVRAHANSLAWVGSCTVQIVSDVLDIAEQLVNNVITEPLI